MANTGPDTNGSIFFILFTTKPQFDGKNTVFGELVQGYDIMKEFRPRDPSLNSRIESDKIINVAIVEE